MYVNLANAGALGFILLVPWNPPGFIGFSRHTEDQRGNPMTMVAVSEFEADKQMWRHPDLMVSIEAPYDTKYFDYYTSPLWTLSIRIAAPLFCALTAYLWMS